MNVLTYDRAPRAVASNMTVVAPPPPTDRVHALPAAQQQLTSNFCIDNATVFDRAPPLTASDLTTGTIPPQTLVSTGDERLQLGPPRVPLYVNALPVCFSMHTVNTDYALTTVNNFQSLAMNNLHNTVMPFYTAPSVTAVVPTAVHTFSSSSSNVCAHQAPSGALIMHISQGPMISFPLGTYPEWGSAAMPVGYPDPGFALPTPMASVVHPAPILSSALPVANSLPLPTDITTTTTATAVTDSVVVDSVSSKLATGLEFLALAPCPPSVETHSSGQTLPIPVAATPTVPQFAATTSATIQQPGSTTAVTTAAPTSTAATFIVPAVLTASTMTSSAAPITSAATDAAFNVLLVSATTAPAVVTPLPITTNTVASSSSSTGIAVSVSSGLNPPGSYAT